jgi:hypothetical protein
MVLDIHIDLGVRHLVTGFYGQKYFAHQIFVQLHHACN